MLMATLAQAQSRLAKAEAAYEKALVAKSYNSNIAGSQRSLVRQELKILKEEMLYWEREVEKKQSGRSGLKFRFGTRKR